MLWLFCASACESGPLEAGGGLRPYRADRGGTRGERLDVPQRQPRLAASSGKRPSFPGLPYFQIDAKYHVPAYLKADPKAGNSHRAADVGQDQGCFVVSASSSFTLDRQTFALTAFSGVEDREIKRLFVPFGDRPAARDV